MRITGLRYGRLRVPLKTPFKTALRSVDAIDDLVVMVDTDDGRTGWGSAPATAVITGDTHGAILEAWKHHLTPRLLGEDVANLNHLTARVQSAMAHNSSAKAAIEIALYDLFGQRHGAPTYQLLGGGTPALTTDLTISVNDIDTMVADAVAAVGRGYTALKIKVGKDIGVDIERVKAIHAAVAGRALLRLDANQGWTPKQAVHALHQLEDAGVLLELVEQPVPAHDIDGMAYVTERVRTLVMADESVFSPADAITIIQRRAADIINIKLMKTGGLSKAIRIADLAALHGVECMVGCMLEGSIGVAAAVHFAVAKAEVVTRIDLDGPALGRFNPVECNVRFDDAAISISAAPGLGVTAVQGLEPLPA